MITLYSVFAGKQELSVLYQVWCLEPDREKKMAATAETNWIK